MIIGTHAYNVLLWVKHHEMLPATERNLIGRRTESDRTADGTRLDGGRNLIGHRTESDRTANGALRGCTCLKCTNKAILKGKKNHTTPRHVRATA